MNPRTAMTQPDPSLGARIADLASELLGFLRRRAPEEAEELAQDTWMRVAAADPQTDVNGFRAYTFTVARRLLIDRHRRLRAAGALVPLDGGLSGHAGPHEDLVASQILCVVEQCLATMKPELAQVFRWRMGSDLSFRDIAERQGCPLNTALGRHHQATRAIARALHEADLLPGETYGL
jgi:RNA polymerase sigma factor (sigma-70 family)